MILTLVMALTTPTPNVLHHTSDNAANHKIPTEQKTIVRQIEKIQKEASRKVQVEKHQKKKVNTKKKVTKAKTQQPKQVTQKKQVPASSKVTSNSNDGQWRSLGNFKITHYCHCGTCNPGNANTTATGKPMSVGRTVAVDPKVIPLHSKLLINGQVYYAEDSGVIGNKVDILVGSHSEAYAKGVKYATVYISR